MKKRILSVLLVLCMALSLSVQALAVDEFKIENGTLTAYNGPGGDVVIPEGVSEVRVKSASESITSITFPGSVKTISGSFCDCPNLASFYVDSGKEQYISIDGCLFSC